MGQRIPEKEIANFQFAVLVPSRVWVRHAPNKTAFAQQEGGALPRQVPAEAPLGTVNEQRQGIITVMIPCLLIL